MLECWTLLVALLFLPCNTASAVYAVIVFLSVHLSVYLPVTCRYCLEI